MCDSIQFLKFLFDCELGCLSDLSTLLDSMNGSGVPLMMNVLETTDDVVLKVLAWINCAICSLAIVGEFNVLYYIYILGAKSAIR